MKATLTTGEVAELYAIRVRLNDFYDRVRAKHATRAPDSEATEYPTALVGHDDDGTNVYVHELTRHDDGPLTGSSIIYSMKFAPSLKVAKS